MYCPYQYYHYDQHFYNLHSENQFTNKKQEMITSKISVGVINKIHVNLYQYHTYHITLYKLQNTQKHMYEGTLPTQTSLQEYDEQCPPTHNPKITNLGKLNVSLYSLRKLVSQGLSIKFDQQGQYVGIGCKNGTKKLYSVQANKVIERVDDIKQNAVTTVKWKPAGESKSKVMVTGDAGGYITFWHIPTLKPLFNILQPNNSIHTIDFNRGGNTFAAAGKDATIRIYDQQTKSTVSQLLPGAWNHLGHTNRIFAVKYIDQYTLVSAGWENAIYIWDLRTGKSTASLMGSSVSGESIDYMDGKLLVGCYAANNQIQIWDIKKQTKLEIDWTGNKDDAEYIYAAGYSRRDPSIFGAGSTGKQSEFRLYQKSSLNEDWHIITKINNISQGCFSMDFDSKSNKFAFSTPHHGFYVYQYEREQV